MRLDETIKLLIGCFILVCLDPEVIVANITKHRFEIYTHRDLLTHLSRELVEVNQICQLLECAPRLAKIYKLSFGLYFTWIASYSG